METSNIRQQPRGGVRRKYQPDMNPLVSKLGLGAAQFGLDSGAAPRARAPEAEVREMLALAARAGVGVLDTGAASAHGEAVMGAVMPRPAPFAVTVKPAPQATAETAYVEAEARTSLARLGLTKADAIMVRAASDLFAPYGWAMWDRLKMLRDMGLFARVGISAYASDDPVGLARRFKPDIIQAPASLLDQRLLVDGTLAAVREMGVEVHLRSIFLHGLLFRPPGRAAPRGEGGRPETFAELPDDRRRPQRSPPGRPRLRPLRPEASAASSSAPPISPSFRR